MSSLSALDTQAKTSITQLIDSLFSEYQTNISTVLGKIDNNGIVTYISVVIICVFFAKIIDVSLTFIFLFAVSLFFCFLIYKKRSVDNLTYEKQLEIKLSLITPKPQRIDNYPDLINFLYSIRDFYFINPNEFYGIVNEIDNFIQLYDQIMNNEMLYCTQNIEVAIPFIRNAQNHLHSMIYNLDTNKRLTAKYHKALADFHLIAQQYISRIIRKCNSKFNIKHINNTSKYYSEYGPHPVNYFEYDGTERQDIYQIYGNAEGKFQFY